ncbi:MAG: glycosyltransferase family 9 protein, partial [Deltaproteobacteria bacterium]|nr:glycosyltransferase family 9 protein [Deltaproteobacteria bacterium]
VIPGSNSEYELAQRMRLLEPLGIKMKPPKLRSSIGEFEKQKWEDWLSSHQAKRPRIGIWPGSRKLERRWPVPFYIQLGKKLLQACGGSLVVLWGPGEEKLSEQFASAVSSDLIIAPKTALTELAGLLRRLDLVVTNDTGPMHMSVAVGRPTVCLFASGDPLRWGHPYPYVRNLAFPGADPQEVEYTAQICMELLARK